MAGKRPRSKSSSYSSDEAESSEAVAVGQHTLKSSEPDSTDSDSGSMSDPHHHLATEAPIPPANPNPKEKEEEEEEEEEGEEEREEIQHPSSSASEKKEKKKRKKVWQRLWSDKDEIILLQALAGYKQRKGKLPGRSEHSEHSEILSAIRRSIDFSPRPDQISNKIRHMQTAYSHRTMQKSTTFPSPHAKSVFELCKALFKESCSKKKEPLGFNQQEESCSKKKEPLGFNQQTYLFHLKGSIKALINSQELPKWLTVQRVLALMDRSMMEHLDAKAKLIKMTETELKNQLLSHVADKLSG